MGDHLDFVEIYSNITCLNLLAFGDVLVLEGQSVATLVNNLSGQFVAHAVDHFDLSLIAIQILLLFDNEHVFLLDIELLKINIYHF